MAVILEELNGKQRRDDKLTAGGLEIAIMRSEAGVRVIYGRSGQAADGLWIYRFRNTEPLPK